MPLFGPPNVSKLKAKRDVKGLIKALEYKKDVAVRKAAATALGEIGDVQAVRPLVGTLKDTDRDVCQVAAEALGKIGDAQAVEPLVAMLGNKSIRQVAAQALAQLNWQPDRNEVGAIYWIAQDKWDKCAEIGVPAVAPLLGAIVDNYHRAHSHVVGALGKIGAAAADPLTAALKDADEHVREVAAEALGQIASAQAVEPLLAALNDIDKGVRTAAARSLSTLGWQPGRDVTGATYWIAMREWEKAAEIGMPAVAPLIAALELFREGDYEHGKIAEIILHLSDPQFIEPLVVALKTKSFRVRKTVAATLDNLSWQPDQSEAGAAYWTAKGQWERCVEFGTLAFEPLVAALAYWDKDVRQAAVKSLDKLGWQPDLRRTEAAYQTGVAEYWIVKGEFNRCTEIGAPAVEPLINALRDEDFSRRIPPAEVLGKIGDDRAVEPFIDILEWQEKRQREIAGIASQGAGSISRVLHDFGDMRSITLGIEIMHGAEIKALCDAIARALNLITGQNFGLDAARWRQWQKEKQG